MAFFCLPSPPLCFFSNTTLQARLRNDTRFKAKPALVEAFEAFDTKPRDAVLSVDESNEFISAYFKAMERFVEHLYTDGVCPPPFSVVKCFCYHISLFYVWGEKLGSFDCCCSKKIKVR